jgi:N-acetylglucosaminyldiphosphoundecaprenol N-acetyl-beta-D-mannosaminyltransferase
MAERVLRPPDAVSLVVTPNIDHIVQLRRNGAFRRAYARAASVLCDGMPILAYARLHAYRIRRITGCDLLADVMARDWSPDQRAFFVVDGHPTARAVRIWAAGRHPARVDVAVPPEGFIDDLPYCEHLARLIVAHGTTLLIMGVGAPRSEIFVDRHRETLPPCWALCVGQAVKVTLGLVGRAPGPMRLLCLEWVWRIGQEPRRLSRRYLAGAFLFLLAVAEDLLVPGRFVREVER